MSIDLTKAHPCPDCRQCLTNADKCQYCAERDQLRAEVERLRGDMAAICRITKGNQADLSKPVDTVAAYVTEVRGRINAATARAEAAESTVAGLRRALEPFAAFGKYIQEHPRSGLSELLYSWDAQYDIGITKTALREASKALAASPDEHARRIKAEALREAAKGLEVDAGDATLFNRGVCHSVEILRREADRLEAANG